MISDINIVKGFPMFRTSNIAYSNQPSLSGNGSVDFFKFKCIMETVETTLSTPTMPLNQEIVVPNNTPNPTESITLEIKSGDPNEMDEGLLKDIADVLYHNSIPN